MDTRQLRRRPDGTYTSGAGKVPCDHCGMARACELKVRTACGLFLPTLPFQNEVGLGGDANTVRVGKAWMTRLLIDQVIALYNVNQKLIFGLARVTELHTGGIDQMLAEHAHRNHLMLTTPPAEAAAILKAWQRQNYGPRIIHENTKLTVIYLHRLGANEAVTYLDRHAVLCEQDVASR